MREQRNLVVKLQSKGLDCLQFGQTNYFQANIAQKYDSE